LFQPIVDVAEPGKLEVIGVEALARFYTKDGDEIVPDDIIPLIRSEEVQALLDTHVLEQSIKAVEDLLTTPNFDQFFLSLNVNVATVNSDVYKKSLNDTLASTKVLASQICLEVSEIDEIDDYHALAALRRQGLKIALSKFGVKYSNLDRIDSLDPDIIKCHQARLCDNGKGIKASDQTAFSILNMLSNEKRSLVATNIETPEQAEQLLCLGISQQQGFFYSDPITIETFTAEWKDLIGPRLDDFLNTKEAV